MRSIKPLSSSLRMRLRSTTSSSLTSPTRRFLTCIKRCTLRTPSREGCGLEKRPHPSLEGVRNVQRLMQVSNRRVGEVKLEEVVDRSLMRKLEDSGFIDRMYNLHPAK